MWTFPLLRTPFSSRPAPPLRRPPAGRVYLDEELFKQVPKSRLMSEEQWRRLGWVHYVIHEPEPQSVCLGWEGDI
uniref:Cyclin-dependent kinases regulatory subunit n=1 Tax=Rhinolophus ferrumequinum TaxID=59479 RepID=A0A671G366_RHIFE